MDASKSSESSEARQRVEQLRRELGPVDQAVLAALCNQIRRQAALEALDLMTMRWTEDEIEIRKHFGLPLSDELLSGSLDSDSLKSERPD